MGEGEAVPSREQESAVRAHDQRCGPAPAVRAHDGRCGPAPAVRAHDGSTELAEVQLCACLSGRQGPAPAVRAHDQRCGPAPGGPVLVSACLLGLRCRYDGGAKTDEHVVSRLEGLHAIPVCPEQLGGLPTPRSPCEIAWRAGTDVLDGRARVVSELGEDRTESFLRGAEEALRIARALCARRAILKTESPSCDPTRGVTAALLRRNGLDIEAAG